MKIWKFIEKLLICLLSMAVGAGVAIEIVPANVKAHHWDLISPNISVAADFTTLPNVSTNQTAATTAVARSMGWHKRGDTWYTCNPGAVLYSAPTRIRNNAWLEHTQCATSTGQNQITVTTSAVASGGTVVYYPAIQSGEFFNWRDKISGFPIRLSRMAHGPYVTGRCLGHAHGAFQCDVDAYFHPSLRAANLHASFELVVVNRLGSSCGNCHSVWVDHRHYRWTAWTTCQRMANGGCNINVGHWTLFYAVRVHRKWTTTTPIGAFAHIALRHGLLTTRSVLASFQYGAEIWSGGKNLNISMVYRRGR